MGGEGGAPYPSMDTPEYGAAAETNFGDPAINPAGAAGSPEGAAEMAGGNAPGPMAGGAMDAAFGGQPDTAAPMDINPADAALGAAMDSAMDQGGAPAPDTAAPMDDAAGMDGMDVPGMDDDPQDDSGSDIA